MTEDERAIYLASQEKIKRKRKEEFKVRQEFERQLKSTTIETFKDRPEEVKTIWVSWTESNAIGIEWIAPSDNNSPISGYHIYISQKKMTLKPTPDEAIDHTFNKIGSSPPTDCFFNIKELSPNTIYYVLVTAENAFGEGYKTTVPFMIRTMSQLTSATVDLYVWGNNTNSELGLQDEQVKEEESSYVKHSMRKVLKNKSFANGSLLDVAPGNACTIFLYQDGQSRDQSIIQSGLTTITIDEKCTQI